MWKRRRRKRSTTITTFLNDTITFLNGFTISPLVIDLKRELCK